MARSSLAPHAGVTYKRSPRREDRGVEAGGPHAPQHLFPAGGAQGPVPARRNQDADRARERDSGRPARLPRAPVIGDDGCPSGLRPCDAGGLPAAEASPQLPVPNPLRGIQRDERKRPVLDQIVHRLQRGESTGDATGKLVTDLRQHDACATIPVPHDVQGAGEREVREHHGIERIAPDHASATSSSRNPVLCGMPWSFNQVRASSTWRPSASASRPRLMNPP